MWSFVLLILRLVGICYDSVDIGVPKPRVSYINKKKGN